MPLSIRPSKIDNCLIAIKPHAVPFRNLEVTGLNVICISDNAMHLP